MNPQVDEFLRKTKKWREEFSALREIILDCGLTEEYKWMHPCYTLEGKNIVLIHGFKEYCAILFFKGALLKDPRHILIQQTENVQAGRQIRFTTIAEIVKLAPIIKDYIKEAIALEKAGVQVLHKTTADFPVPAELQKKLKEMPALKTAFAALTPGRQRAYLFYFAQAKRSKTREERIAKYLPQILAGKGLND